MLAHLVPRLTNRVEDTATDALAIILNKSSACRDALDLLLREGERSYHLGNLAGRAVSARRFHQSTISVSGLPRRPPVFKQSVQH